MMKEKILKLNWLLGTFLLLACDNTDLLVSKPNENFRPAADFIRNNYDLSLFYTALEHAGLVEELNGDGPFTVFAPGNTAFNALGIQTEADIKRMDVDSLRFMLHYHVLGRILTRDQVPANSINNKYINLADTSLLLSVPVANNQRNEVLYINGASVLRDNVRLANGVLHVIDKVLKYHPSTVQSLLETRPEYSTFLTALKRFGFWEQLASESKWTVMAPTNAAFEKQGITKEDIAAMNPADYGKRLFGAYLFPLQFLYTDGYILVKQSSGGGYYGQDVATIRQPIPEDENFHRGISGIGGAVYNAPFRFFVIPAGEINGLIREVNFGPAAIIDYVATNGVVHGINDLILYPSETLID